MRGHSHKDWSSNQQPCAEIERQAREYRRRIEVLASRIENDGGQALRKLEAAKRELEAHGDHFEQLATHAAVAAISTAITTIGSSRGTMTGAAVVYGGISGLLIVATDLATNTEEWADALSDLGDYVDVRDEHRRLQSRARTLGGFICVHMEAPWFNSCQIIPVSPIRRDTSFFCFK